MALRWVPYPAIGGFSPSRCSSWLGGRLIIATGLRTAIDNDQLILHYQPKMDIRTGKLAGVETLVRWQHPVRGIVSPTEFVPIAEQTNLIQPLTHWVLDETIDQMQRWRNNGLIIPVAINLSTRCLAEDRIPHAMANALKRIGSAEHNLTLEITESALLTDAHRAQELLIAFRSMGVKIFIDDFGTGFSSLAYLAKLPVNALKIDHSFVTDILEDCNSNTTVGTIIAMAHELNLRVVAEGIETQAVLDALTALGCDIAQGYYFGKPIPADALVRCITAGGCHEAHPSPGMPAPHRL